jgi:hypothetical protein
VEFKNSIRSICRIKDIKKEANPTLWEDLKKDLWMNQLYKHQYLHKEKMI